MPRILKKTTVEYLCEALERDLNIKVKPYDVEVATKEKGVNSSYKERWYIPADKNSLGKRLFSMETVTACARAGVRAKTNKNGVEIESL
jgi:hypothetical protein